MRASGTAIITSSENITPKNWELNKLHTQMAKGKALPALSLHTQELENIIRSRAWILRLRNIPYSCHTSSWQRKLMRELHFFA